MLLKKVLPGAALVLGFCVWFAAGPSDEDSPPELGRIDWVRGFDDGVKKAEAEKKPLLVLFQEVPGCSTCKNYGSQVLSHPLIQDAAETLFVPVVVYNNVKGDDEKTLKSFNEKAWNNPVVRIIMPDRKPLAERVAGDYTVGGLASAMVEALKKDRRDVPKYLNLLVDETSSRQRGVQKATFAMPCFWAGEVSVGVLPGVISTMPGFLQGKEVIEVEYDPSRISYPTLVQKAKKFKCATTVFARSDGQQSEAKKLVGSSVVRTDETSRPDKEPKYYVTRTSYKYVPMTELQAIHVNAALCNKKDPKPFLSPRQLKLLGTIEKHPSAKWPNAIGAENLPKAWQDAEKVRQTLTMG